MDCPFCGSRTEPYFNYCGNCGKCINNQASPNGYTTVNYKKTLGPAKIFLVVVGVVLTLLSSCPQLLIEGRIVPSESMMPTIMPNDRVLVNKLSYLEIDPSRGDIIVFNPPASVHAKTQYIKRVIGIPGDVIQIRSGKVYINGKIYPEDYLYEPSAYDYGPVKVPAAGYFVLGDNRNSSFDSHLWYEYVSKEDIFGKVVYIYWPSKHWESI